MMAHQRAPLILYKYLQIVLLINAIHPPSRVTCSETTDFPMSTCGDHTVTVRQRRSPLETTSVPMHCPPCEQIHCYRERKRKLRCKGGVVLGVCGCCRVCAKLEGEQCGGQHDYLGKCDQGLFCELQEPAVIAYTKSGVKRVFKVEKGICRKAPTKRVQDTEICKPKCDPEYCLKNPRGICSAIDNGEKVHSCRGVCQHTSCRACRFVEEGEQCSKCAASDFKCIKEFGRCVRKLSCKAKTYPCGIQLTKKIPRGSFVCQVPECLE